jgi:hypothetical protein
VAEVRPLCSETETVAGAGTASSIEIGKIILLFVGVPNVEGALPFTFGQLVDVTVSRRQPFVKVTFAFGTANEKLKQSGKTEARWPATTQNLVPAVIEYDPINRALTPVIVSAVNVAKVEFGAEDPLLAIIK